MTERELTLRYLWDEILVCVAKGKMQEARIREQFYSSIEEMTDGEYVVLMTQPEEAHA